MNTILTHDAMVHDSDFHPSAGAPFRAAPNGAGEERRQPQREDDANGRGPGRPSSCTPEKLHAVCAFIRLTGLSDTAAAAMAGVKRSTLARWKQEDEEVEMQLDQARFQYQAPRLAKIGETRLKDGQLDWRAQAWLVKFANPQEHGAPSRRRKLQDVELEAPLTPEEQKAREEADSMAALDEAVEGWRIFNLDPSKGVITPMMLALHQQRRAIAIREMNERLDAAEHAKAGGEVPAVQAGQVSEASAGGTKATVEAAKSVTIHPEIRQQPFVAPAPLMDLEPRTEVMAA